MKNLNLTQTLVSPNDEALEMFGISVDIDNDKIL